MGLGVTDLLDDGGGKEAVMAVSCSICLDAVTDNGDRSWAKLQCGHQFHLDCIGSAFNVKGAMQCPNCRKVEKGQWLYGNGGRPLPEFSMEDWAHDEDLYDFGYSEMSLGVHWCPFSGIARLPSSFEEGEYSSNTFPPDLVGHNAFFADIAYIGPIHPSSSTSSGSVSDGSSSFNNHHHHHHWSGPAAAAVTSEGGPSSYGFPSMDVNVPPSYHHSNSWDRSMFAGNSHIGGGGAEQQQQQQHQPSLTQRSARNNNNSDIPRPGMHPYIFTHSSASRAPSSITSSMLPPYTPTVTRPRDRNPSLQPYFHQSTNSQATRTPPVSARRARVSDQAGNIYYISSPSSSSRAFQEPENPVRDRFHAWDRDHQLPYQVDRESSIWGPFYHPPASGSDPVMRSGSFRQRHGSQNRS